MDDVDIAQRQEENQRDRAIAAALQHPPEEAQHRIGERVYCLDCDIEIPEARLTANPTACRCIECQQAHEQARR